MDSNSTNYANDFSNTSVPIFITLWVKNSPFFLTLPNMNRDEIGKIMKRSLFTINSLFCLYTKLSLKKYNVCEK